MDVQLAGNLPINLIYSKADSFDLHRHYTVFVTTAKQVDLGMESQG